MDNKGKGIIALKYATDVSFINTIIQCLCQTPKLTEYFLNTDYLLDINQNEEMGYVAIRYATLLQQIWSNKYDIIDSNYFNKLIFRLEREFERGSHQNAEKFLSYLLSALHKDLLKDNKSIIMDDIYPTFKTEITCPHCSNSTTKLSTQNMIKLSLPEDKHRIIEYTLISADTAVPATVYGQKMPIKATTLDLKEAIAPFLNSRLNILTDGYIRDIQRILDPDKDKSYMNIPPELISVIHSYHIRIDKDDLFVCDIWKSKIHRELRKKDALSDINSKYDDIFIYCWPKPNMEQYKSNEKSDNKYKYPFQTYVINHEYRGIKIEENDNKENESKIEHVGIGYPLLITLPLTVKVKMCQIYKQLWMLNKPFIKNQNLNINNKDDKLPFELWARWGEDEELKLTNIDDYFDTMRKDMKFIILWLNPEQYKCNTYDYQSRPRDRATAKPFHKYGLTMRKSKCSTQNSVEMHSNDFMEAIFEEKNTDENLQHCVLCNRYCKMVEKEYLWKCSNIVIIHLDRLSDKIDKTIFVDFPVIGLDLKKYLNSNKDEEEIAADDNNYIYDLYAVSNYMHNNVYTTFTKNMDNKQWYYYRGEKIYKVTNTHEIVTNEAYLLFYCKRYHFLRNTCHANMGKKH